MTIEIFGGQSPAVTYVWSDSSDYGALSPGDDFYGAGETYYE